jgi:tyrosyl-tRNA synthetase
MGCDLQIGGSDQWGNILLGVDLIRRRTGDHVHAFTWPLLLRADGKKYGKSEAGTVWLDAQRTSAYQLFQYWMQVADADVRTFLLQLTLLPVEEVNAVADAHEAAPERREGQRRMARANVALVHGEAAAAAAEEATDLLFGGGSALEASPAALEFLADEIPTTVGPAVGRTLVDLLASSGAVKSKSEARRLGSVTVNGAARPVDDALVSDELLHGRWALVRKGRSYFLFDVGRGAVDR